MRPLRHRRLQKHLTSLTAAALLLGVSGCATHAPVRTAGPRPHYTPSGRQYPPPGPPEDPWGPYIRTAAARFAVPEPWIRAVMRQESSGLLYQNGLLTTSSVGAMGLMQVMPDTYAALSVRYGLGGDPYEPHDNILAGTAYIREMYDSYGFPAFLAAYNAGPHTLDACLIAGAALPQQTISYLSSVAPRLRPYARPSGPLAAYAEVANTPADDLNARMLMGQALPTPVAMPVLPCMPPASDRSADRLNAQALTAAGGGSVVPVAAPGSDRSADRLNAQALMTTGGAPVVPVAANTSDSIADLLNRQLLSR